MEDLFGQEEARKKNVQKEAKEWARSIALAVIIAIIIRLFLLEVFLVEGNSMFPTLQHRERLIVNKAVYYLREPAKGEIVVFTFSPNRDFIKRVIAVEDDVVLIRDNRLYINEQPVEEPYLQNSKMTDYGPAVVPEASLFVLGDNRGNSMDSRDEEVGFISIDEVRGRAFLVFWPPQELRLIDT